MLHDSHISSTDSDVARDVVPATVSMDPAIVEPPDGEFPDVWGEGTNNPWQNWQPNGNAGSVSGVDDDGVIELELVDSEDEFDNAGRGLGLAGNTRCEHQVVGYEDDVLGHGVALRCSL